MVYNKLAVGIDPGKTGAIVILDQDRNIVYKGVTPLIGKEYDKDRMSELLIRFNVICDKMYIGLEDVTAIQLGSKSSNFDFGRGKGLWEMALMTLSIPHTLIYSKTWQKEMWQGIKKQYKVGKKKVDTKLTSLLAAKHVFPGVDFRKSERSENPHDGIVDALLMAEYVRRKFL